ncbi:hypothetical protein ACS127_14400 [Amphibacillus sp. Q70]|uniref:hypothetical protein n=1 Tax=Amphibacillus sp. Q70 TaxID=3453416 RepID=UPI003F853881
METQVAIYGLLLFALFISISVHNFRVRIQCIYPVTVTKTGVIIIIVVSLVFLSIAYYVDSSFVQPWLRYLLSISASFLVISRVVGEGIHERGIYYYPGRRIIATLVKWEDIENIEMDRNKNRLISFRNITKRKTIYPNHYYRQEDMAAIEKNIYNNTKE